MSSTDGENPAKTGLVLKALLRREHHPEDPLAEVRALAQTVGLELVDGVVQKLDRPHSATYLGKGKVEEAAAQAAGHDVDFIVVDHDLTPAQERNLERITGRTVIDRTHLIMDIFALRAQTHQAKLQVELAQLRYTLPRLKRLWTHLSRYEGGIGMRGPGETQLETDKRLAARRIQHLARELRRIERRQETSLSHREGEFVVALVGYTNTGKSTLLNALTGSSELVEDKLFATLDTRVRRWMLSDQQHALLTDTVGFIRDLPPHLVASFQATLAETRAADLLLHVVDASSRHAALELQTVRKVLRQIGCAEKPTWLVLNKWDQVEPERLIDARNLGFQLGTGPAAETAANPSPAAKPSFAVSAKAGTGLDGLREAVLTRIQREHTSISLSVPYGRGDVLAYLREHASSLEVEYGSESVQVRCELSRARYAKLKASLDPVEEGVLDTDGEARDAETGATP